MTWCGDVGTLSNILGGRAVRPCWSPCWSPCGVARDRLPTLPEGVGEAWPSLVGMTARPLGTGHINSTLEMGNAQFVLQRINGEVFKNPQGVMANLARVTAHVRATDPDLLLEPLETVTGAHAFLDATGDVWRLFVFAENTRTLERLTPQGAQSAGAAFGRFVCLMSDYPGELEIAIDRFHDLDGYLEELDRAVRLHDVDAQSERWVTSTLR